MEERIKEIIKKKFNANILEIKKIKEGHSHHMYEVKFDKKPNVVVVRFSNNTKKEYSLGKEKYVMELLDKNNIPVPKIYAFEEEYMIMEKFSGLRLDTIWDSLSKKEKLDITEKIGRLLSKIHNIKLEKFGKIEDNGNIKYYESFKFKRTGEEILYSHFLREILIDFTSDLSKLLSYKRFSLDFISNFMRYVLKNLEKIDYDGKPTLIHGDFSKGHIFVEKKKTEYEIQGTIDFEFSNSTSPFYDFIKLHREGFFDDSDLKEALKRGYGKMNEEAVEIFRLMRDLGFAWAVLERGDKELSEKILKTLEEKINKKL